MTNRRKPARSAGDVIASPSGSLSQRLKKAQQIATANERFVKALTADLARNTRLINLRGSVAVLATANASWGSRLRLHRSRILNALARSCKTSVSHFEVKVVPDLFSEPDLSRPQAVDNKARRKAMGAAATGLADPELARRLKRLSER
ncbi:MAG: hypothetical protein DHS20C11_00310 [Lysobacteraceae bacterium]|nr:MAG: hypothetical protein DHS20C11_00310 [Xanthomonadaceae bacterium]